MTYQQYNNSETQYRRHIQGFLGVDVTSASQDVNIRRMAYSQNVYKDYYSDNGGCVESFPGYRRIMKVTGDDKCINGIIAWKVGGVLKVVAHIGTDIYIFDHDERDNIATGSVSDIHDKSVISDDVVILTDKLANHKSRMVLHNGNIFVLDGSRYSRLYYVIVDDEITYYCEQLTDSELTYLPITYINGEQYEQRNMLNSLVINRETQIQEDTTLYKKLFDIRNNINGFNAGYYTDILIFKREHGFGSRIGNNAFANNNKIQYLYTDIEWGQADYYLNAFAGSALKHIIIQKIRSRYNMFGGCEQLKTVVHMEYQTYPIESNHDRELIGNFEGCTNIKKIVNVQRMYYFYDGEDTPELLFPGLVATGDEARTYSVYSKTPPDNPAGYAEGMRIYYGVDVTVYHELDGTVKYYDGYGHYYNDYNITEDMTVYHHYIVSEYDYLDGFPVTNIGSTLYSMPLYDETSNIESIRVDGTGVSDNFWEVHHVKDDGTDIIEGLFTATDYNTDNKTIDVVAECLPATITQSAINNLYPDIFGGNSDYHGTTEEAIDGCTIMTEYDGRLFLSGNPELPNTVFYTGRGLNGTIRYDYIGVLNYINDGTGLQKVVELSGTTDSLIVYKEADNSKPTIYYHTGADTEEDIIPRVYPGKPGLAGIPCMGRAYNFYDDSVFLSKRGLDAIGKLQLNNERSILHRSTNVDRLLVNEELSKAEITLWDGYLMIFAPSGNVYMADSRQTYQGTLGSGEYEFFLLSGVGETVNKEQLYRYRTEDMLIRNSINNEDHYISNTNAYADITIDGNAERYKVKMINDDGTSIPASELYGTYLYVGRYSDDKYIDPGTEEELYINVAIMEIDGVTYAVPVDGNENGWYTTDSNVPAISPVATALSIDDVLYMGTESGCLMVANTDKRGLAHNGDHPQGNRIHQYWYNYDGMPINAIITTAYDDAGYPGMAKKTVSKSLVIDAKTFDSSLIANYVRTDRTGSWKELQPTSASNLQNSNFFFGNAGTATDEDILHTVKEKEKKWGRKQYQFSDGHKHCNPIGVNAITYRFVLRGRIKS